jgi:hypothetical protein
MKTLLLSALFLFLFCLPHVVGQNAFHDALFIESKRRDFLNIKRNLDTLKPKPTELDSTEGVKMTQFNEAIKFLNNPFDTAVQIEGVAWREVLTEMPKIYQKIAAIRDTSRNSKKQDPLKSFSTRNLRIVEGASLSSIPSTSFLSATQIIDGTALFIKQRVKEELSMAFMNRFRKRLDENDLFAHLFPATHRLLQSVADMDNSLPSLNNIAVNAFQIDMETLPENIESALLYDSAFSDIRQDRAFKYFALPFNTVKHMRLGSHPAWILQDLREKYYTDTTEIDRIIQMMVAFNDNLRDTTTENDGDYSGHNIWVSQKQWSDIKNKKSSLEYFMGLIFQKNKNSLFSFLKTRPQAEIKSTLQALSNNVDDYLVNLKNFESLHYEIQDAPNRIVSDSLALELGWAILQLVDKSHLTYFSLLGNRQSDISKNLYWNTYKPLAEATLKAVSSLQRKNYGGLMLNTYQILRGLSQIEKWKNGRIFGNEYLKSFFYYGNFMTDVLMSSDARDVQFVLERYAAPVGSYSVKRKAAFSVALNAYPGLYFGWEFPLKPAMVKDVPRRSFVSGVTAPIGLSLSHGGLGKRYNQSLTAFISVIDIGAVLSYRWSNDVARGLPQQVEWAQVMAPGLHFIYGLPELPLSLTVGFQMSPQLRKVSQTTGNELSNSDFYRIGLGLTADITIFNFYRLGKRKTIE